MEGDEAMSEPAQRVLTVLIMVAAIPVGVLVAVALACAGIDKWDLWAREKRDSHEQFKRGHRHEGRSRLKRMSSVMFRDDTL